MEVSSHPSVVIGAELTQQPLVPFRTQARTPAQGHRPDRPCHCAFRAGSRGQAPVFRRVGVQEHQDVQDYRGLPRRLEEAGQG